MPKDESDRLKVLIYDTGKLFYYYEDEIYDPPDGPTRKNCKPYNEEESDKLDPKDTHS